jgi:hypothetical protein
MKCSFTEPLGNKIIKKSFKDLLAFSSTRFAWSYIIWHAISAIRYHILILIQFICPYLNSWILSLSWIKYPSYFARIKITERIFLEPECNGLPVNSQVLRIPSAYGEEGNGEWDTCRRWRPPPAADSAVEICLLWLFRIYVFFRYL